MIKARIYRKNQKICGFEISGHAGYAQAGEDIVCSAVTVLCFNTVNAVEKFTASFGNAGHGAFRYSIRIQKLSHFDT